MKKSAVKMVRRKNDAGRFISTVRMTRALPEEQTALLMAAEITFPGCWIGVNNVVFAESSRSTNAENDIVIDWQLTGTFSRVASR